ncbi:hypothetical protein XENTR_v10013714 [Xenopus tropicalis]|uniref:Chromosome 1 open reading frame 198 n=1 Tax=Xenopus tropicalis TaxID=8364 RepID=A0A803JJE7_XENTR|nr:uncharacterized protein C1orf198 homolog [Xenopus tropicalis]KAE8601556.1 hypothetical protein XENTR_v10013714 [Xenopus tropicalis]|eukprot:XP_002934507.2 PREDICTED: uncharacterized protein C1orf198 homolog [Xenopus tropicalis]
MASMAAAIAAARTACTSGNMTLDEKERNRFAYFSSLNSMAKKIMQDKERMRLRYGPERERIVQPGERRVQPGERIVQPGERIVQPGERDSATGKSMADAQSRGALRRGAGGCQHCQGVSCCPILRTHPQHKLGHFMEEESEIDSSSSLYDQHTSSSPKQTETKQPLKPAEQNTQLTETPHGNQLAKSTGNSPTRKHEESAFRKINPKRFNNEGFQSDLPSTTPSQIKPLGEQDKPIPNYHRQDLFQKEGSEKPHVVTKQPKTTDHILTSFRLDLDETKPSQSPVSSVDSVLLKQPDNQVLSEAKMEPDIDDYFSIEPQLFSQTSTSNVILKTGFDFLDNW